MTRTEDPERYERAQEIFTRARDLGTSERDAFLDEACTDDEALRREVESLLATLPRMEGFLDDGRTPGEHLHRRLAAERSASRPDARRGPERIGPYRIVRRLGEGGMGVVYEAEQAQPRRRVALKVLRAAVATPNARRRFERETELLARLSHPCIAKVHEAGVEADVPGGPVPWFAMELVEGRPLNEHARGLDRRACLELLAEACDAVAHAHASGLVHRDLKPDNVLVDEHGRPKLLDFGVARLVDAADDGAPLVTRTGDIVGTLTYMSPEQALGGAVDARADVYSLGVIGFELLTGRLPHELDGLGLAEATGRIRDIEAERLGNVDPSLRGDLDAIIATALSRDPDRRYSSAAELAADLRRHVRREPVAARPPSATYRAWRFAQRNRPVAGAIAGVIIALSVGVAVSTHQANEARREQYRANVVAAMAALRNGRGTELRRELARAPVRHRGWEWHYLNAAADTSLARFRVSQGAFSRQAFARDDDSLTVMPPDGVTRIGLPSGGRSRTLLTAAPDETPGALSPNARHVLVASERDALLVELDSGRRQRVASAPGHPDWMGFSPRGTFAWVSPTEPDQSLALVDTRTGDTRACVAATALWPAFTADERHLLIGVDEGSPAGRLWDVPSCAQLRDLPGEETIVTWAVSPDGRRAVGGTRDGRTAAWDLDTGRRLAWLDAPGSASWLHLAYNADGSRLVVAGHDGQARLVDGRDGKLIARFEQSDERASTRTQPAFSPDGRWLAVVGARHAIRVFAAADGSEHRLLTGHESVLNDLAFNADGTLLASLDAEGNGRLWDLGTMEDAHVLDGHESYVYGVAVSPDGERIASAAWDGTVRLWDSATGLPIAVLEASRGTSHGQVAFSPGGSLLASAHGDEIALWDTATGDVITTFNFGPQASGAQPVLSNTIAWHPRGTSVVFGSARRPLHVVSMERGRPEDAVLSTRAMHAEAVAFSPNGKLLAVSVGHDIELWDAAASRRVRTLTGHDGRIRQVAFSPDARWLASASEDSSACTWSVTTGRKELVLRGESSRAFTIAWSPDGTRLATGGDDKVVRIWDADTSDELAVLEGHAAYVHGLAFSPDGSFLVSGSGDATVRLWDTRRVGERQLARRERHRLEAKLRPLVEREHAEVSDRRELVERLRALAGLDPTSRRIALDLALSFGRR